VVALLILYLLVMLHILDFYAASSFAEIQSPARAQGLCVHRFDAWLAILLTSRLGMKAKCGFKRKR
jgi:hypothetical protein